MQNQFGKIFRLNLGLFLLITLWVGIELLWLPNVHNRLSQAIQGRISASDQIASLKMVNTGYPHVLQSLEKNRIQRIAYKEEQVKFTSLVSETARESRATLNSFHFPETRESDSVYTLISQLEITGNMNSIQQFLALLENNTLIINVESLSIMEIEKGKVKEKGKSTSARPAHPTTYQVNIKLSLSKILTS